MLEHDIHYGSESWPWNGLSSHVCDCWAPICRECWKRFVRSDGVTIFMGQPTGELPPGATAKSFTLASHGAVWEGWSRDRCSSHLTSYLKRLRTNPFVNSRKNLHHSISNVILDGGFYSPNPISMDACM